MYKSHLDVKVKAFPRISAKRRFIFGGLHDKVKTRIGKALKYSYLRKKDRRVWLSWKSAGLIIPRS